MRCNYLPIIIYSYIYAHTYMTFANKWFHVISQCGKAITKIFSCIHSCYLERNASYSQRNDNPSMQCHYIYSSISLNIADVHFSSRWFAVTLCLHSYIFILYYYIRVFLLFTATQVSTKGVEIYSCIIS